jgi:hypothetical protein
MRKLTSILDTRYSILDTRYSILLILLVGLLFSNFVSALEIGSFEKRCKVEYTQLDLITGVETIYKETSQFTFIDHCKEGLKRLDNKVYKWVDKKSTNIITKINEFRCKIKNIDKHNGWSLHGEHWGKYRDCVKYIPKLSGYLVEKYPNQIGARIYQEFDLIQAPIAD